MKLQNDIVRGQRKGFEVSLGLSDPERTSGGGVQQAQRWEVGWELRLGKEVHKAL